MSTRVKMEESLQEMAQAAADTLRPYKDLFPEIGQRVMIDTSSVVIGDVRLADDVGIWPLVV
ncbi:hypothetical protein MJN69_28765, partial [Salmonella enterica subsp. enterica serovar Kentucky]|nr:hypothetical protein [Salmonella enterica subsp. enterica serovar Kentucky]